MAMQKKLVFILLLTISISSQAEIPYGYYDPAEGLSGESLQWALHNIIDNHTVISYNAIKDAFYTTDDRYGNEYYVWDMYSNENYVLGDDFGGSASGEGEGYNREHSWPKSWFNDQAPMNTDLFHIVPSDIYVNNRRSNYPYAEVGSTTWVSQNGSRVGVSITPGYSGTAFEPIDDYKGDFARTYFYMATRYKGEDSGWAGSAMADGADLENWAVEMLIDWHDSDPVSTKEIDRNDAVYAIQNNRNPFIDHPEYVEYVYDPQSGIEGDVCNSELNVFASPNPFSSSVQISYNLDLESSVTVQVFDVHGRLVSQVQNNTYTESGFHQLTWNGTNQIGAAVDSGIYFIVLSSESFSASARMVCVR